MKGIAALTASGEIRTGILSRSLLMLLPLVSLAIASGNPIWLKAAIITMSAFIVEERSDLAPLGVLLHGTGLIVGFFALLLAFGKPTIFVLGCTVMAVCSILVTAWGAKLRSLGIFTFVPALYLACESAEGRTTNTLWKLGMSFLPFMVVALIPPLILSLIHHHRERETSIHFARHFRKLIRRSEHGKSTPNVEAMIAVAMAVATAAGLVEWQHLAHGQWVIWSAASVVTGDAASAHLKLRHRTVGTIIGVPIGAGLGLIAPHNGLTFGFATLAVILSLVAFRRYAVSFTLRCIFGTTALVVADKSSAVAAQRVSNVLLGGLIGILFVLLTHFAFERWRVTRALFC